MCCCCGERVRGGGVEILDPRGRGAQLAGDQPFVARAIGFQGRINRIFDEIAAQKAQEMAGRADSLLGLKGRLGVVDGEIRNGFVSAFREQIGLVMRVMEEIDALRAEERQMHYEKRVIDRTGVQQHLQTVEEIHTVFARVEFRAVFTRPAFQELGNPGEVVEEYGQLLRESLVEAKRFSPAREADAAMGGMSFLPGQI